MGALMVDGLPSLMWDGNAPHGQLHGGPFSRQADGIKVLFETCDTHDAKRVSKTAILSGATTVQQIKLSGRHQGWFRSGDKLVRPSFTKLKSLLVDCSTKTSEPSVQKQETSSILVNYTTSQSAQPTSCPRAALITFSQILTTEGSSYLWAQVLGGRELLEHECLGHLPREKDTGHLHVYVKLSDLNNFSILSSAGTTYSYKRPATSPKRSALTASLASSSSQQVADTKRCDPLSPSALHFGAVCIHTLVQQHR